MPDIHEFTFPIESGHVLAFRRAIGEPDDPLLVPPTFTAASDHFDPRFDRRPPRGQGWSTQQVQSHLHVEQHFTYLRDLAVGETFRVRRGPGRTWNKHGRSGPLEFVEQRTELLDAQGARVVDVGWVDVHAATSHVVLTNQQRTREPQDQRGSREQSGTTDLLGGRGGTGDVIADMAVASDISRTQITMYVGASGDFHPLHHDEDFAVANGYPSVFVPGMLTMALTGRALCHLPGALRSYGGRFRSQVWPGDSMRTVVTRTGDPGRYDIATTNQRGESLFSGYATCTVG